MTKDEQWLLAEKYGGEKSEAFFSACERLKTGEPLAYLIGHVPFLDTTIHLDSHPLIPRPETEFWTERAISSIRMEELPVRVLDLCAGSGAIGVAVAKAIPNAHVDFAEIDPRHHATIKKNIEANGIDQTRTRIFGGDLFENVEGAYDFILSNPPYIDPALDRTEASVKKFEPHTALYGGEDGVDLIERIIAALPDHLTTGGTLYLEHEPEQAERILELTLELIHEQGAARFRAETHADQYGVLRYTTVRCDL